jgi:hypothetical protein
VFEDGLNSVPVEMEKNTLKLLIEGLRQLDEMKPIFQALLGKRLFIKFERPLFEWGLHEATPRMCQLLSEIAPYPQI